jgi:hypothetical protein
MISALTDISYQRKENWTLIQEKHKKKAGLSRQNNLSCRPLQKGKKSIK